MDLEKFVRHFGFKVVRVNEDRPYRHLDGYDSCKSTYYTSYDRGSVEMEIGRRELEHMANYFEQSERLDQKDREEEWLRRQYPGLKDAYDKYQMLLALYK